MSDMNILENVLAAIPQRLGMVEGQIVRNNLVSTNAAHPAITCDNHPVVDRLNVVSKCLGIAPGSLFSRHQSERISLPKPCHVAGLTASLAAITLVDSRH